MKTLLLVPLVALSLLSLSSAADHPNVIVFLTDDQGWGDLSLNGNTNLSTPNVDSLAADGAMFESFYVCPVCSPTRAEFLTGRYAPRSGVYSTSAGGERLDTDEHLIAETFKAAGYATAAFGKWHNGMQFPYHPNARGFDEFYGFCSGHWGNYFDPLMDHNNQMVRGEGFCIDDFTNHAMEFIEENQEKPFFVYLPYNTPHSPMQVPDEFWDAVKDRPLDMHNRDAGKEDELHLRAALAMCENIDWNVGRVLEKLDDLELAEDTIVVFFHDNGPNGVRWNGDMKGKKGSTDEGGVRSPLLVRWPEKIPAGTVVTEIAGAIDLYPTLAGLAGIETGAEKPLDGLDLTPLIRAFDGISWPDRRLVSWWRGKVSVRDQQFRLGDNGELYHLASDPGQRTNVADKYRSYFIQLSNDARIFRRDVESELPEEDPRPFVIAHPGSPFTQIPARDGTAHGNIERSNKFPNCSYFLNWTSVDDAITWDAEVAAAGDYEVEVWYTCPAGDVGSTIELSFGDSRISAKVTEAHDPPVRGAEEDRSPRMESYVKDFEPMNFGVISLPEGPGELRLQATEIPGDQAMEFRLLTLRRVR